MRADAMFDLFFLLHTLAAFHPSYQPDCRASPLAAFPPPWATATAFVNVDVITMENERVLLDQTVIVKDGKITALGPATQISVPAGSVRIDGRGKYLMPGLIDMHGHLWGANSLPDGVTGFRIVFNASKDDSTIQHNSSEPRPYRYSSGDIRDFIAPGTSLIGAAAAYKAAGYPFLAIPSYYHEYLARTMDELTNHGRRTLAEAAELKLRAHEAIDSLLAAARLANLPLATHSHLWSPDELMLRFSFYDGGSIEHVFPFMRGAEAMWRHNDKALHERYKREGVDTAPNFSELVDAVRRAGIWITPTLGCHETGYGAEAARISRQIVKALQDAGVPLLLGADNRSDIHRELRALVGAGLSPYQALLTGTRHPAEYFGLQDSLGTVTAGKWADLVLLRGNPLQDIQHAVYPAGIMLRGRWISRQELDRLPTKRQSPKGDPYWALVIAEAARQARWLLDELDQKAAEEFENGPHARAARTLLADSLTLLGRTGSGSRGRVYRLVAAQLGEYRSRLTPAQQSEFNGLARGWLRKRAEEGYSVAIPGLQP